MTVTVLEPNTTSPTHCASAGNQLQAAARTADAARARAEAEALAHAAAELVASEDPLPELVARLRLTFALDAEIRGGNILENRDALLAERSEQIQFPKTSVEVRRLKVRDEVVVRARHPQIDLAEREERRPMIERPRE